MSQNVYCTLPSLEQADEVIKRMQRIGFSADEVIVADGASGIETLIHPESDYAYSTKVGVGLGFLVGAIFGIAQMFYIDSASLNSWAGAVSLPLSMALGWALYGWVVGGSGVFARNRMPAKVARHFEEEVADTKVFVTVPLHKSEEWDVVKATLSSAGARDIHFTGVPAV